jgi:hypothetical protein
VVEVVETLAWIRTRGKDHEREREREWVEIFLLLVGVDKNEGERGQFEIAQIFYSGEYFGTCVGACLCFSILARFFCVGPLN